VADSSLGKETSNTSGVGVAASAVSEAIMTTTKGRR